VPILIIVAALGISAAIFFLFTKKKMEAGKAAEMAEASAKAGEEPAKDAAATPANAGDKPTAAGATASTAPAMPSATTPATAPAPAPASFGFARPLDLGKQMARSLAAGDFATAGKLAAAADPAQAAMATQLMQKLAEMGLKPGTEDQVELLGLVENRTRIAVPLMKPGSTEPIRLLLDIERDERMGWKVSKVTVPKEASAALAAITPAAAPAMAASTPKDGAPPVPAPPTGAPSAPPAMVAKALFAVEETQDALSFASDFVRLLLEHDFTSARKYVDEKKVPVERLVGLCIVFEEGQYRLKPSKPLIVTVANPEVSWVIAQVESESLQQSTEFGLELKRESVSSPWKVGGVNLSQILGSFAQSANKLGIPYTPIVQNPKGGESLALYFEYDQAQLHPRAQKQLEVVAGMLKADPAKKLRITGHTDARGDDTYNVRLSQSRAESVKQQLVALGVPADQVETTGLGKAQPLSPNQKADGSDDPAGRSRNRRAEIFLDF
jgi:outer membrane protein OmpA-like peptidoglycan-associated protein